jgi:hypothetical protein
VINEARATKQEFIGDSLVRREDPTTSPEQLIAAARERREYAQSWPDLENLATRFKPGESLVLLASGSSG